MTMLKAFVERIERFSLILFGFDDARLERRNEREVRRAAELIPTVPVERVLIQKALARHAGNVSEAAKTLKRYKGTAWDQSPLFKRLYEEEYGQFGGEPYGCLVGDYHFDHTPPDVELLDRNVRVEAARRYFSATGNPLALPDQSA